MMETPNVIRTSTVERPLPQWRGGRWDYTQLELAEQHARIEARLLAVRAKLAGGAK